MTAEIEDAVRALLAGRVADGPENPERVVAVRGRVAGIRRRRVAGLVCGLAVLTAIGLLGAGPLTRLADTDPRPAAPPMAPPYFDPTGTQPAVAGYETLDSGLLNGQPRRFWALWSPDGRPYLLVARCARAGTLTVTGTSGAVRQVPCSTKVSDGYEGALALTGLEGTVLLQSFGGSDGAGSGNLIVTPGGPGLWAFGILAASEPDWLPRGDVFASTRYRGWEQPATGTFTVTPKDGQVSWTAECVDGVVLTFRSAAGALLATAGCTGSIDFHVPLAEAAGPDAPADRPVRITVEKTGRDTNQWLIR
jgi:hypothetical protein